MKILKILLFSLALALPIMIQAQTADTPSTPPAATTQKMTQKKLDPACMQRAVEKRDNALQGAVDSYASAVKSALGARRDALKAAWGITDNKARRLALQSAWKTYAKTVKSSRDVLRKARLNSWEVFRKDRSACGPGAATIDPTPSSADSIL